MSQQMTDGDQDTERPWQDEQLLEELYVQRELSQREIASALGCSRKPVGNWINRFGIERDRPWQDPDRLAELRERGLSFEEIGNRLGTTGSDVGRWMRKLGLDTSRISPEHPWHDAETLRELYWGRGLDMGEIGDELGCSRITIREWMDELGIETRSVIRDPPEELTGEGWLRPSYVDNARSTYDIADELDCAPSAVFNRLNRHEIGTRDVGSQPGELHHRWKGGTDPYYGPDWCDTRRSVLERDGKQCTECGMTEEEHLAEYGRPLHVHHLQPIREFDNPETANTMDDLTTLCHGCHMAIETRNEGGSE